MCDLHQNDVNIFFPANEGDIPFTLTAWQTIRLRVIVFRLSGCHKTARGGVTGCPPGARDGGAGGPAADGGQATVPPPPSRIPIPSPHPKSTQARPGACSLTLVITEPRTSGFLLPHLPHGIPIPPS